MIMPTWSACRNWQADFQLHICCAQLGHSSATSIMGIILDGSCNLNLLLSFVICYII